MILRKAAAAIFIQQARCILTIGSPEINRITLAFGKLRYHLRLSSVPELVEDKAM